MTTWSRYAPGWTSTFWRKKHARQPKKLSLTNESCFAFDQPGGTREETELEIKSTGQAVDDSQQAVTQARLQLANSPETLRLRNQLELNRRTAELNELRAKLAALQKHLSELNSTNAPKTPSEPEAPATRPD
jgi:multidrug efflux pump subunit AcrB